MSAVPLDWSSATRALTESLLQRCTFPPPGSPVTCAVSGGADSTALAILAVAHGCEVVIAHVDHGLRPTSGDDIGVVRALAERLGVTFRSLSVTVAQGPNLEARARVARYGVLPLEVLTGHTADDQAETMLINLLRGASTTGLAAMRPGPHRPLLAIRRAETELLCESAGATLVDDESNLDPRFVRNRVRHEVLPLLDEIAHRDLVPLLVRQAELLRSDDDLLDELAALIEVTDARAVAAAPTALARRAIRRWLSAADPSGHPPDLAAVERVLAVAAGETIACEVAGIGRIERHQQRLSICPSQGPFA